MDHQARGEVEGPRHFLFQQASRHSGQDCGRWGAGGPHLAALGCTKIHRVPPHYPPQVKKSHRNTAFLMFTGFQQCMSMKNGHERDTNLS